MRIITLVDFAAKLTIIFTQQAEYHHRGGARTEFSCPDIPLKHKFPFSTRRRNT
jgi:hypothetical protein